MDKEQYLELAKKNNGKRRKNVEEGLQIAISQYLKTQYPKVIFRGDLGGFRLPIGLAKIAKILRFGRGMPDVDILEPRGKYKGLFFELKTKSPFTQDGKRLLKQKKYEDPRNKIGEYDHIEEQAKVITHLKKRGYLSMFIWEFDKAKQVIDWYMGLPENYE